jgi:hypothetical protein
MPTFPLIDSAATRIFVIALLGLTSNVASGQDAADSIPKQDAELLFAVKVFPLLQNKCFGCHGGDPQEIRGEYDLTTREGMLTGGESGEASLVPGQPQNSPLFQAILWEGSEMPPKENDRLTAEEAKSIEQWIQAGAPWPDEATRRTRLEQWASMPDQNGNERFVTSGGLSDEWSYRSYLTADVWAFKPALTKEQLQTAAISPTQAIDHYIQQQLDQHQLQPAKMASPRTLIRRVFLDLTGLPPTPEEITTFENAWAENADRAWENLVDQLLGSPRYGERWGRHWLDVTRYADTGGMSNDYERSNMWRYRDYVIRSLNADKPYDEFVIEQLAGDELADQSVKAREGGDIQKMYRNQLQGDYTDQEAEWIIATGFLRLGPWDNAMVDEAESRQMYLDDVVNITGQTFLGQTLRCCKCHDHKFDPIPTRDYYRLYSAFSTTFMAERPVPFLPAENLNDVETGREHVQRMLDYATQEKDRLIEKRETAAREWFEARNLPYLSLDDRKNLPDDQKPPRHVGLNYVDEGQLKVREQDVWIWTRRLERYEPMAQSVYEVSNSTLAWNGARKLRINRKLAQDAVPTNYIFNGGDLTSTGPEVQPGVLSALGLAAGEDPGDPYLISGEVEGRRLALARWIAHPQNGLTTRSIVNRIWQYHFGSGLAANPNNLGVKGSKPTHPELLDWLADDFVENGWKMKRLHRAILLSKTYRQNSTPTDPEKVLLEDPDNRWLSYFPRRRLSAEEIRDGALFASGELQHSQGGLPVYPEINMEVALQPRMIQFSLAPAYQPSPTPDQRNRRSVYAYVVRGQADPFGELFNQPNPNESCERREAAAVTPQVFTLLNSTMMTDRSIALAVRLESEAETLDQQIQRGFNLVLGREPTEEERIWMTRYISDMQEYHDEVTPEKTDYPQKITRSLVEEFSGKPFAYEEILPVFQDYHPDQKPTDVSSSTRALADMCLLLLNTNEYIFVQ